MPSAASLILLSASLAALTPAAAGAPLSANEIMARVAANQDRAQLARQSYVHEQTVRVRLYKANNKLLREETEEFIVTPRPNGVERERKRFEGRVLEKKQFFAYGEEGYRTGRFGVDASLAKSFREMLYSNEKSKDGLSPGFFPLTSRLQPRYQFHLDGEETYRGRPVYRIRFEPIGKVDLFDGDAIWMGEILVDQGQFQPVVITTKMARGLPLWAKTIFGTNVKQVGFKLTYEEFEDGVWFPVSYGGEFHFRVLFLYSRTASVALTSRGFRRASVESKVEFAKSDADPPLQ